MAAVFGYDDVGNHASMLVDPVRMRAFSRAIELAVRPDDVVADVGSGTGILALLCAKAGARHVYAIERGPMAQLIERAAAANALADRVSVIRSDARAARFPDDAKPTLIVSEMIGSFGLDEDYLGLLGTVRAKCAPGCRVLPQSIDIELALADIPALTDEIATVRSGLGPRLDEIADLLLSRVALTWVRAEEIGTTSTPPRRFRVGDKPSPITGDVRAERDMNANAIVGWFRSELVDGASLTSAPNEGKTHWANLVFPLPAPLVLRVGDDASLEVRPRLLTDRGTWSWMARRGDDVRKGDAMKSLIGGKSDMMRQLGLREAMLDPRTAERLPLWAAALGGGAADVATMARRMRDAFPGRFADDADAEAEVLRLVRSAQ